MVTTPCLILIRCLFTLYFLLFTRPNYLANAKTIAPPDLESVGSSKQTPGRSGDVSRPVSVIAERCKNRSSIAPEKAVHDHILKGYQKSVRPRRNSRDAVDVKIYLVVHRIDKVIEKDQEIHFTGYLGIQWFNEYFVWNDTEDLSCVESVLMPVEEIWMPDVAITNSGTIYGLMMSPGHKVEVGSDGNCYFYPETTFSAFCNFELSYFPFDDQLCTINVESWLSTAKIQRFIIGSPAIHLLHWSENQMWHVAGVGTTHYNVTYEIDQTEYDRISFMFYLQRKPAYYNTNIIVPSTIISCVELVTFTLPTAEVLKMVISFTALLAYTVFQLMIVDDVPRSGTKTPLLSVYIVLQMAYIGLALAGEGFIYLVIENVHKEKPVPNWLDKIARVVGYTLWLPPDKQYIEYADKLQQTNLTSTSNNVHNSHQLTQLVNTLTSNGNVFSTRSSHHDPHFVSRQPSAEDLPSSDVQLPLEMNTVNDLPTNPNYSNGFLYNSDETRNRNHQDAGMLQQLQHHQRRIGIVVDEMLSRLSEKHYHDALRHQWLYIANVSKRCIFLSYLSLVALTPLVMFTLMPLSKPDLCKLVDCF